jgi:mono/diheme cytochrome c family protein
MMVGRSLFLKSVVWLAAIACGPLYCSAADVLQPQSADVTTLAHKILADRCYKCHGAAKQEGELRLDLATNALKGGEEGIVIHPGRADDSLLIEYVAGKGDTVMPPKGARLTEAEVAVLKKWIDGGAKWPTTPSSISSDDPRLKHWSFQPVRHVPPPVMHNKSWTRNEIDAFILAKLEKENVEPSAEADRRTLIRRLSFDLLGLPPTSEEVETFLADSRPDAYEKLVDHFLASSHFGERWARHWLDRARYADTSGCVIDLRRPFAWRWRDWVIDAINNDLPFDQFTIQQIAGDLLPQATTEIRVAAGFQGNALTSHEAGVDLEAERVKTTLDRTSAVGTAWLGLTVGCAQCHSHKYDPISQRDFYSLYAFFDNLDDHLIDAPLPADAVNVANAESDLKAARDKYVAIPAAGQEAWETKIAARPNIWKNAQELETTCSRSSRHAMIHQLDDDSLCVDGRLPSTDTYVIAFKSPLKKLAAVRIESLTDPDRFDKGPGRGAEQHTLLTGITIQTGPSDKSLPTTKAEIASVTADYCQPGFAAADAIKCGEKTGWSLDQIGVPHAAVFTLRDPVALPADGRIIVRLEQYSGRANTMTRFRISVTDANANKFALLPTPDEIRALARRPASARTVAENAALKRYFQSIAQNQAPDLAAWNAARSNFAKTEGTYAAQTVRDRTTLRATFVHLRGDFRRPGENVEPGLLPALSKSVPTTQRLTRLDLAKWIVDPANPLTARVAANDIWQHLFGVGLVDTPGDFGMQGDPPSHPELLDWLASEYVRCGWSRKTMIRNIVCSATYRQSSTARSDLAERDPKNRWLARQYRFRLEAESVRDTLLACSGLLDRRIGGPGYIVNPSPDDALEDWERQLPPQSPGDIYRRGMYAIAKRTDPDATLNAFDAPDGMTSCPLRRRTNTPIQSLTLLNDPVFVAATRALSKSDDHTSADDAQWISALFARCTSRQPTAAERKMLAELFQKVTLEYRAHPQQAARLAQVDALSPNAVQAAAGFVVARTILNLDEVVTRE